MQKAVFPLIVALGFLSAFCLYWSGSAYQRGGLDLTQAFTLLRYSAIGGICGTGLCIFYLLWQRPMGAKLLVLFFSAVFGLVAFYLPYRQQIIARQVPRIHDITTDTTNPPVFVDVLRVRAGAPNPPEYDGADVARQQREGYPDLVSITFDKSQDTVFVAALELVQSRGWNLVASNQRDGRIEATATTRWFGFKDDVVIRIRQGQVEGSTLFDMRSKSRVGGSDIGTNAARIRAFIRDMRTSLSG